MIEEDFFCKQWQPNTNFCGSVLSQDQRKVAVQVTLADNHLQRRTCASECSSVSCAWTESCDWHKHASIIKVSRDLNALLLLGEKTRCFPSQAKFMGNGFFTSELCGRIIWSLWRRSGGQQHHSEVQNWVRCSQQAILHQRQTCLASTITLGSCWASSKNVS
eukprot:2032856-Amphidinium_carterae.1